MLSNVIAMFAAAVVAASDGQTQSQQDDSQGAAPKSAAATQLDPDQIVCRTQAVTGSRFTQRVCRPRRVWDEANEASQRMMRDTNRYSGLGSSSTSGGGMGGGGGGMGQ